MLDIDNDTSQYWQEKLSEACRQTHVESASLGIVSRDRIVAVNISNQSSMPDHSLSKGSPAFCVAKLFTATLVATLVGAGKLGFEDVITDLLPVAATNTASTANLLAGITVAHLLSHTHGLTADGLNAAPVNARGFIDDERVFGALNKSGRIFAPGTFYSYGVAGYILLGLVIEHVTQLTFGEFLRMQIMARICNRNIGLPHTISDTADHLPICPSSGNNLNLSLHELMAFTSSYLKPDHNPLNLTDNLVEDMFGIQKPMPGWSPTIAGICYGWKRFANSWHGHDGMDSHNQTYIRVNRASNTAICLIAHSPLRSPGALSSLLFRHDYPELSRSTAKQPAILLDALPDDNDVIIGAYGDSRTRFLISLSDGRPRIEILSIADNAAKNSHQCYLYPAEDKLFFLSKPWQYITFLQLVTDGNGCRYLWDHTQLWPALTE